MRIDADFVLILQCSADFYVRQLLSLGVIPDGGRRVTPL
jgi:hypothetical protein